MTWNVSLQSSFGRLTGQHTRCCTLCDILSIFKYIGVYFISIKKGKWTFWRVWPKAHTHSHPVLQYFLVKNWDAELYRVGRTESELYCGLPLTDYLRTEQLIPLRATRSPVSYKCMTAVQISVGRGGSRLSSGSGSSACPTGLFIQPHTHRHTHIVAIRSY